MSNFLTRTITGVFIVLFIFGGFWLHPVSFFLTGLIIAAGCQYEYYRLMKTAGIRPQMFPGMITGLSMYTVATLVAAGLVSYRLFLVLPALVIMILITELFRKQVRPFDSLAHTFLPLLYVVLPLSLLPFSAFSHTGIKTLLNHGDYSFSPGIILGFLALLWINDTGAYLSGITFGKHRLYERISPGKTWEGFAGGLLMTMAASMLLEYWPGITGRAEWMIVAVIVAVAGTLGDLTESMLKRSLNLKDSGSIMPGHGGFLDRFDSILVAFPVAFMYFILFG
ncbi:MAG: phosphatidate cytidylyltransferase [Bacteroidales bacterium]|nr:phosphatidate cytidylyltransferase [Bacteroidales bacterium]